MPNWQQIRNWLSNSDVAKNVRLSVWKIIRKSESPLGFLAVAAFGLTLVLILNIPGTPENQSANLLLPPSIETQKQPLSQAAAIDESAQNNNNPAGELVPNKSQSHKLRRNETLIGLLKRAEISNTNAHAAVNKLKKVTNLRKLKRNQEIHLRRASDDSRTIQELRIRDTFDEEATVKLVNGSYEASREPFTTYGLTHYVEGTITDSLYLSAKREGLPDKVIVDLIRLLSFDVDFEREIRTGDHFEVYFERTYAPTFDDIEEGRILKAVLTLQKRTLEAFYFKDSKNEEGYYDSDGKSTRRALMKTPLDVTVVTSSYGKRKHPVLGYTRMHKGVDFRARTGTPIMAAGDGVIERASRYGSYGNYIRIRHNNTYKTAYAHLSRYGKGIKKGKRVKQGQTIGYAGATGRVSAAHLHYEVIKNGKQTNPLKLKLPTGRALKGDELLTFKGNRTQILAEIEKIRDLQTVLTAGANPAHSQAAAR